MSSLEVHLYKCCAFQQLQRDSAFRMENAGWAAQVSVSGLRFRSLLLGETVSAKSLFKGFISVVPK